MVQKMDRYVHCYEETMQSLHNGILPENFTKLIQEASQKASVNIFDYNKTRQWSTRVQEVESLPFIEALDAYQKIIKTKHANKCTTKRNIAGDLQLTIKNNIDPNIKRVVRSIDSKSGVSDYTILVDRGNEHLMDGKQFLAVPVDDSWLVINQWESVIFVDENDNILLVVLRGVGSSRGDLLSYVSSVVEEAAKDRRNVRPSHKGKMIQFGQNAGPRHMRFYGIVNNILRKQMSVTDREHKDRRILGVFGLSWAIFLSVMPKQVTDACESATSESEMSSMTYTGDSQSQGYILNLEDGPVEFTLAHRSPSEGYLVDNYTSPVHIDHTFCDFTLSWNTSYDTQGYIKGDNNNSYTLGGNFVDVSLKVVVLNDVGTALATCPLHKHGTTRALSGLERQGVAINWSTHILEAFNKMKAGIERGELVVHDGDDGEHI